MPFAADVAAATEEDVRAGDLCAVRLERRALETDGRKVVLAAAVRAAAGLDMDLLDERVVDAPLLHRLGDRGTNALRRRTSHRAGVRSRAGEGARDQASFPLP